MTAILVALLTAALIAAMSIAAAGIATGRNEVLPAISAMLLFHWPLCFAIGGLLGLPAFWLARKSGRARWWTAAIAGLLVGVIVPYSLATRDGTAPMLLWFGVSGAISGLTFWLVWRWLASEGTEQRAS